MRITVDVAGLDDAARAIVEQFSARRLNAAAATALTLAAQDARMELRREIQAVFDRPTPYAVNSPRVYGANASKLYAEVELKDDYGPRHHFLRPQVDGGTRPVKRFEYSLQAAGVMPRGWVAVPAVGARLDAYGNVSRGQIIQVLSQLRITLLSGFTRNMSTDARKQINAQRKAGGRYFVVMPGSGRNLHPGIYIREFVGRNITPVFLYVRSASYRPRLDFTGIVRRVVADRLPVHLRRALQSSAARLATR